MEIKTVDLYKVYKRNRPDSQRHSPLLFAVHDGRDQRAQSIPGDTDHTGGRIPIRIAKGSRTGGAAVKTVFFLSQAAAKQFVKQGGIRVPPYTASKSGVKVITMLLANEWAKYNINVNAIAPGYMAADNTAALRADEKRLAEILDRIPACRWGLPGDLAGPVMFLASKAPGYVNGYTLAVDGGWLAR